MSTLDPKGVVWVGLYASNLALLIHFYENKFGFRVLERDHDYCIFDAGAGDVTPIFRSHLELE
jgi:predicted enzyme related to lactoylglutathione lyase